MQRYLKESADEFSESALCDSGRTYQLLLSGFCDGVPIMISGGLYPKPTGEGSFFQGILSDSFASIGSGSTMGTALLSARECNPTMTMEYVSYLVYEAKRSSERTGGVGEITQLMLHVAGAEETPDRATIAMFSDAGFGQLELYYRSLWKVPVARFPDFPEDYFIAAKDLKGHRFPITDQSPPLPSPESPEGSDES